MAVSLFLSCSLFHSTEYYRSLIKKQQDLPSTKLHSLEVIKLINSKNFDAIDLIPDPYQMLPTLKKEMVLKDWQPIGSLKRTVNKSNLGDITYCFEYKGNVHELYLSYKNKNGKYCLDNMWILGW